MALRSGVRSAAWAIGLLALGGCHPGEGAPLEPSRCLAPELLAGTVAVNPDNVLSAEVTVRAARTDSVGVRFGIAGTSLDSVTPAFPLNGDSAKVPLLGLQPEATYRLEVVAHNGCGIRLGLALGFTTGPLPADLPRYRAGGPDPAPGFVAFGAGSYGLVIDNSGRVVWYRRFPGGPGLNFQPQPNGHYAARPGALVPAAPAQWVELDVLGRITRTMGCARGLEPRFHDLIALTDGSYWTMCDETRVMDLTAQGGVARAQVMGTVIQHLSSTGALLFEWSPFDHFRIDDLEPADRTGATVNWTHGNAIDLDAGGNLLVSFRSLSEITSIDTRTGAVRWRMGGRANQFAFAGTGMPAFFRQHGLRVTSGAQLTLLDNLGQPFGSRAERYQVDEVNRTVRLVSAYGEAAGVTALVGGTTQSLVGGRVLVSFGNGGAVQEYAADGSLVWGIEGSSGYVFRATRIHSLYAPGVGDPR